MIRQSATNVPWTRQAVARIIARGSPMTAETIVRRPTDAALAAAIEENLYALFRAMATLPASEIVEGERLSHHLAFPANPMFKGVWRTRLTENDVEVAIDETIAWFQTRHAPFFFWWTGPETTPADLGERLVARGLISIEAQQHQMAPGIKSTAAGAPGMVADLDRMNEAALEQVPAGFTIEEVGDEPSLLAFKDVLIAGYGIPAPMADGWVQAARRVGIGRTPWRMYLGRLAGEPVATNMLFTGAGVASIYGVATVPAARGRGIGGAISLKPLLDAREAGYRQAVLFATDEGKGCYTRIGFRDCGVRLNRYLWRNT
jgi:ribosomal protein S18 acetylase RimI-like enzyme